MLKTNWPGSAQANRASSFVNGAIENIAMLNLIDVQEKDDPDVCDQFVQPAHSLASHVDISHFIIPETGTAGGVAEIQTVAESLGGSWTMETFFIMDFLVG